MGRLFFFPTYYLSNLNVPFNRWHLIFNDMQHYSSHFKVLKIEVQRNAACPNSTQLKL